MLTEDQLEELWLKLISRLTIKRAHDSTAQTYCSRYVCPMCAKEWLSFYNESTHILCEKKKNSHNLPLCQSDFIHTQKQTHMDMCTSCISENKSINLQFSSVLFI